MLTTFCLFFDHLSTPYVDIFYLKRVDKKVNILDYLYTYPPPLVNVVKECPPRVCAIMGCLLLLCYVLSMYYLLQKFREYVLNSNRMARLQAKYDHIRMTLGDQSNQPNEGQSTLSRRPNVNRRYVVLQYMCDGVDRQ